MLKLGDSEFNEVDLCVSLLQNPKIYRNNFMSISNGWTFNSKISKEMDPNKKNP